MKKLYKKILLLALITLGHFMATRAQQVQKGGPGMWPVLVKYTANQPVFSKNKLSLADESGGNNVLNDGFLKSMEKDNAGFEHYRYQQKLNGIPVENSCLLVHVKSGKIVAENGKWVRDFPTGLAAAPALGEAAALNKALQFVGADQYKWELPAEESFLKIEQNNPLASFFPKAILVYYSGENDVVPGALRLAYKFDIYAQQPLSRQLVFVDAGNGKILGKRELIHETNAPGTALTAYSSTQPVTTDFNGSLYTLKETGRGNGINTFNLQKSTSYASAVDFTDADNNWNNVNANKDEYATDAHWGAEKTYDYYLQKFNRNSIDNAGMALNSYVHYNTNYFNAFWDGSRMTYGDGDAAHGNKPLTSLDVCGHEITHGLTERTSQLVYSYESGALNEGFSDIFGTAIEAFARPSANDWLIGGDFYTIRSMSNPNTYNQPDTYLGNYWYYGTGDNGGVHINSGVLNYWFYLLTVGGNGVNDHGYNYNVTSIGIDKAAAIAYRLNTFYLVSTSAYADARTFGILAAEDLYGTDSNEAIQTANAFAAVGLYGSSAPCNTATNLLAAPISNSGATLNWDPVPGAIYYRVQYKTSANTIWTDAGTVAGNSFVVSGLSPATTYDWKIKPNCNDTFSQSQFITYAPSCTAPANLIAAVNNSTAILTWNPVPYGMNYLVEYRAAGDINWIFAATVAGTTDTLTGLQLYTLYEWRVRSNCSGSSSPYATAQFTSYAVECAAAAGLAVNFSGNLTTMHWNPVPNAAGYIVQLKNPANAWTSSTSINVTDTSYTLANITPGTTLEWRVRTNCGTNFSVPSSSALFTTPCAAPTSPFASGIIATSAILNWTAPALVSPLGYYVQTKPAGTTVWSTAITATTNSINYTGLTQGKTYDWRVALKCANGTYSAFANGQFTTLCAVSPSGLRAYNITTNSAVATWTHASGVVSYNLQYKKASETNWTTVNAGNANYYTLTNLSPGTTYNQRIQTVCTVGTSTYTSPVSFTTYCTSSGINALEWIDYFYLPQQIGRNSGAETGGYVHAGLMGYGTNLQIGSTVTGTISAGFPIVSRSENYAVYIDYNNNGIYTDAGEQVATGLLSNGSNFNFTFTVPATLTTGIRSVRVVLLRAGSGVTISPCLSGNRGEVEDYFVNLVTTPSFGMGNETTSAGNNQTEKITISPNPSDAVFKVQAGENLLYAQYFVMDSRGQLQKTGVITNPGSFNLDLAGFPAGLYLLRIREKNNMEETFRLIKK